VIEALFEVNALYRLRSAQGVLRLAEKHTATRLEAACHKAIEAGDPSYRTVKGVLEAGLEHDPVPEPSGDGGAAAFLRGPSQLFADVIPLSLPEAATTADTGTATGATVIPMIGAEAS
jgi:hypothetical protein